MVKPEASGGGQDDVSRRMFLQQVAIAGGFAALTGSPFLGRAIGHADAIEARRQARADEALEAAQAITREVAAGMETSWRVASVWPGLALIPPGVPLYQTATLHQQSRIDWPHSEREKHLGVQRPFMVEASIQEDVNQSAFESADIKPEVMGFWLPASQSIAFCDRAAYKDQLVLATSSQAAIYISDYQGIYGERVHLEAPVSDYENDLTWRYLNVERPQGNGFSPVMLHKVCGRSAWLDMAQASEAYQAFASGAGDDIVQLPRGIA